MIPFTVTVRVECEPPSDVTTYNEVMDSLRLDLDDAAAAFCFEHVDELGDCTITTEGSG